MATLQDGQIGAPIVEVLRKHGVSLQTCCHCKAKYGGSSVPDLCQLKEPEAVHATLKPMYATPALENVAIKDVLHQKPKGRARGKAPRRCRRLTTARPSCRPAGSLAARGRRGLARRKTVRPRRCRHRRAHQPVDISWQVGLLTLLPHLAGRGAVAEREAGLSRELQAAAQSPAAPR